MNNSIFIKLLLFNGITLNKSQWEVVLKGAGCPKSTHFWTAFRNNCLTKNNRVYTLLYFDEETAQKTWQEYCNTNRASVMKVYYKKKARKKIEKHLQKIAAQRHYFVNPDGTVTFDNPNENWDKD